MKNIDELNANETRALLHQICDVLGTGSKARFASTVLASVSNACRRSDCLSRIENIHTKTLLDEYTSEPFETSLLNWGQDPDKYEETYRRVIDLVGQTDAQMAPQSESGDHK